MKNRESDPDLIAHHPEREARRLDFESARSALRDAIARRSSQLYGAPTPLFDPTGDRAARIEELQKLVERLETLSMDDTDGVERIAGLLVDPTDGGAR